MCVFSCGVNSSQRSGPQAAGFPSQSILSDPMSNLAMAYGSSLASQGREMMDKNVRVGFRMIRFLLRKNCRHPGDTPDGSGNSRLLSPFSWTDSSPSPGSSTTLLWTPCTWERNWDSSFSPTCMRFVSRTQPDSHKAH